MWDIDLSDTDLDFVDTDILSKYFVCLQDVVKTSSRHVSKTTSRHVLKKSLRKQLFVFQDVSNTSSKTFSRCLEDVLEDEKLLRWTCGEYIFRTGLEDQQMFAGRKERTKMNNIYRSWLPFLFNIFLTDFFFGFNWCKYC